MDLNAVSLHSSRQGSAGRLHLRPDPIRRNYGTRRRPRSSRGVAWVLCFLHGYQRFTKDVDLVIELVADRALKALQTLEAMGYKPTVPVKLTDFADPAIREAWIRDKGMMVFQMYSDQTRMSIDIFVQYPLDLKIKRLLDEQPDTPP
jgi:hypothetical protein